MMTEKMAVVSLVVLAPLMALTPLVTLKLSATSCPTTTTCMVGTFRHRPKCISLSPAHNKGLGRGLFFCSYIFISPSLARSPYVLMLSTQHKLWPPIYIRRKPSKAQLSALLAIGRNTKKW